MLKSLHLFVGTFFIVSLYGNQITIIKMELTREQYLLEKQRIELLVNEADYKLKEFTKNKVGAGGLVSEVVRLSFEYRLLTRNFNHYFSIQREFNCHKDCKKHSRDIQLEKRKQLQKDKFSHIKVGDTVSHEDYTSEDFIVTEIDKVNNIVYTSGGKNGTWFNPIELIIKK